MTKILLVDDMKNFLDLEVSFLRRADCEIFTASTGLEAIKIAKAEKPDIIMLDLIMPEMGGIECTRILKSDQETKNIPIVIVTSTDKKEESFKAGADDFMQKPIDERAFLDAIKKFVPIKEREEERVPIGLEVAYKYMGMDKEAFSRDISKKGIFLITDRTIPVGTKLDLKIKLPTKEGLKTLELKGEVVREEKEESEGRVITGIGVAFEPLDQAAQQLLDKLIDERISSPR